MPHSHAPSNSPRSTRWTTEPNRQALSFMGYYRTDGRVGTRNYWLVIPLVSVDREQLALFQEALVTVLGYQCPNVYERQLRDLREQYRAGSYFGTTSPSPIKPALKPLFTNIDGIEFLPLHEEFTGNSSDIGSFPDRLAAYCTHANVGGITMLSGGNADDLSLTLCERIDRRDPTFDKPLLVVDRSTYRSDNDWLTAATHDTFRSMALLNKQTRRSAPLSRLVIGTQPEETNESFTNQVVDECVQFMASVGATVLVANSSQLSSGIDIQPSHESTDKADLTTALADGCTLQLTRSGPGLPLRNALVPVIPLAPDNDRTQPGEPLLKYLIKLASGELLT